MLQAPQACAGNVTRLLQQALLYRLKQGLFVSSITHLRLILYLIDPSSFQHSMLSCVRLQLVLPAQSIPRPVEFLSAAGLIILSHSTRMFQVYVVRLCSADTHALPSLAPSTLIQCCNWLTFLHSLRDDNLPWPSGSASMHLRLNQAFLAGNVKDPMEACHCKIL